jgi:hypothetical protein
MGMKQNSPQALYSYWNQVRAGRQAPQRLEIEPSQIAGILSETFMLERIDAATYQFRLAGTRLCEQFGRELRGTNFLDGWDADGRRSLQRLLVAVCDQAAGLSLTLEGATDDRRRVEFEAMLLPLTHGGTRISRIIGAMSATTTPYWLGSDPLRGRRLERHQLIWPDGRPHALIARASGQAPFAAAVPARSNTSDRRQFRVVEGGRLTGKPDKR